NVVLEAASLWTEGARVRLSRTLDFPLDAAEPTPASAPALDQIARWLADHPDIHLVRVEGHADAFGPSAYNYALSLRRAEAVVADLTRRGLPAGRISAVGRGEASPIASNADETGRSLNRRVEVHCD
ncbi:MAG: OmpA family protein, partial [Myxococcales bacterium]|nr:OmpA family protein [Myxococcales bacterium]